MMSVEQSRDKASPNLFEGSLRSGIEQHQQLQAASHAVVGGGLIQQIGSRIGGAAAANSNSLNHL